ncbi:MAG: TonB-dependent receptor [Alphaproteobacteria bacterium]|nr:TonB-dependent receptor [Alphaproteobacteria bacterium]
MLRQSVLLGASCAALGTMSDAAQAQGAPGGEDSVSQQEIVVTARRREEALIDVPASIAVLGAEQLERQGVVDFQDLAFAVPNVSIFENSNIAARSSVTIRGVPGRAGIYRDDVFVGDNSGINGLLIDVERVEVIRGPQGTLFGRNALSGAINTLTRRPDDEFSAAFVGAVGDYGQQRIGAAINGPIVPGLLAGKISAGWRQADSYDEVRGFGDDIQMQDEQAVVSQLLFTPTSSLDVLVNYETSEDNNITGFTDAVRDFAGVGGVFRTAARDGNGYDRVTPGRNLLNTADRDQEAGHVRLDWRVAGLTATSVTASRNIDFLYTRDGDGTEFDQISGIQPVSYESFSQELRLASDSAGRWDWMIGAYYFSDERRSSDSNTLGRDFVISVVPALAALAPELVPGGTAGVLTPSRLAASATLRALTGLPLTTPVLGVQTTNDMNEIESLAFFGSLTFRPTEQWEVNAGLRQTNETVSASFSRAVSGSLSLFVPTIPTVTLPDSETDDLSPSLTVSYFPSDDLTFYGSYSTGFRSGGYNLAPGTPRPDLQAEARSRRFDPERLISYEVGVKSSLADGRVGLNAAIFMLDYEDFQRSFYRIDPVTGPQTFTANTTASVQGVEIDALANLTDELQVTFSYGYQKSEYDDFPNAPINTTAGLVIADLTGDPLPFVPENSATFGVNYERNVSDNWAFRIGADVQYRSDYIVTDRAGADPEVNVGATTLINGNIALRNENDGWSLVLRGYNLSDEIYRTGLDFNTFTGAVFQSLSAPRTWSFEVRKDF